MRQDLVKYRQKNVISARFAELESINIDFIKINQKDIYVRNYPSLHKSDPPLSPDLSNFIEKTTYDNPKFIPSPRFQDFVRNQTYNFTDDLLITNPGLQDTTNNNVIAQFKVMKTLFKNSSVRDYAMYSMLKYDLRNYGLKVPKTVVTEFLKDCRQLDYKKDISDNYRIWSELAAGLPAPAFLLPDKNGTSYNLNQFKGKYIYIDVWATWCGPCLEEMSALEKLVSKFSHQANKIAFIKISIDLNKTAWLNKIISVTESGTINLHAIDGANSKFAKAYVINDIPRYILIDDNGNIVNANALAPSSSLIDDTIANLLKKANDK